MRGKLRDKRATGKRDGFKQVEVEQRRPYKRDTRVMTWIAGQEEEDEEEDYLAEIEEGDDADDVETKIELPVNK